MPKEFMSFEEFLIAIIGVLDNSGIDYMLGGAVGAWAWGEPRSTQDIDLVISMSAEESTKLSQELEKIEIYLPPKIMLENLYETRADLPLNAIHGASGFKAEMFPVRAGDDLRRSAFSRRRQVDFGSEVGKVYVHSPEDLIVYKLIYFSISQQTKHIRDIGSILKVSGKELNFEHIEYWVQEKGLQRVWEEIKGQIE
jgi:hypothetical protein